MTPESFACGLAATLCLLTLEASAAAPKKATAPVSAIVLPIEFAAIKGTFKGAEPLPEVTAAAKEQLERSYKLAFARHGAFQPLPMPELSADESVLLAEKLAYVRAQVAAYSWYRLASERRWIRDESPAYSVGPGLAFLAERGGSDRLIYMYGTKYLSSGGNAPLMILVSPLSTPTFKNTMLSVAVLDLKTGDILWMNQSRDINADVTTRGGANAYMLPTFGEYPKGRLGRSGHPTDLPEAKRFEDSKAKFTVTMPRAWQRLFSWDHRLLLTRHGTLIDAITIERREPLPANLDPVEIGREMFNESKGTYDSAMRLDRVEAVTVSGLPGFVADSHFNRHMIDETKMVFLQRRYGVVFEGGLYLLSMSAPRDVYFDRDLPQFESLVATLELGAIPSKKKDRR